MQQILGIISGGLLGMMICTECNSECEFCQAHEPWWADHWICPACDSTFCIGQEEDADENKSI